MSASIRGVCNDMQQKALQAETLLTAALSLIDDKRRAGLGVELVQTAIQICCEINETLDSAALNKLNVAAP